MATGFKVTLKQLGSVASLGINCVNWAFLGLWRTHGKERRGSDLPEENATINFKMDKARWVEIFSIHLAFSLVEQHDRNNFIFIWANAANFIFTWVNAVLHVCMCCLCLKTRWKPISSPNSPETVQSMSTFSISGFSFTNQILLSYHQSVVRSR